MELDRRAETFVLGLIEWTKNTQKQISVAVHALLTSFERTKVERLCASVESCCLILRGQTQKDCVPVWRSTDSDFERTDTEGLCASVEIY